VFLQLCLKPQKNSPPGATGEENNSIIKGRPTKKTTTKIMGDLNIYKFVSFSVALKTTTTKNTYQQN